MIKSFIIGAILLTNLTAKADFIKEPFKGGMIIAEWDLAFPDLKTYEKYLGKSSQKSTDLIINTINGKTFDVWNKVDRMELTYCVSDDFKENKKDVVNAIKIATQDWMDVAVVKFIYKSSEDKKCNATNANVKFDVRPVNVGLYLARAFFPNYERSKRSVLIDSSSFDYSFVSMTGFIRHEFGHVLGFRHEHISKDGNGECPESGSFSSLTPYDQLSVMHYPQCGGLNKIDDMILSELDKTGAAKVYPKLSKN